MPAATKPKRHTYVAPGPYSTDNPWGRVPPGGTLNCRFHEINDKLEADLLVALQVAVDEIDGLILIVREHNLPALQWVADATGAYWLGSGLEHRPKNSEDTMRGFLWLQYRSDADSGKDCRPLDIELNPVQARDVDYLVDLIIAGAKAHRR